MWRLQVCVVGSGGIWLGGVNAGMLCSSFAIARASFLQHLYSGLLAGIEIMFCIITASYHRKVWLCNSLYFLFLTFV